MIIDNPKYRLILLSIIIITVLTSLAYKGISGFDFVNFDDKAYVYENEMVQKGVTLSGLKRSFTEFFACNWHPITMISYLVDVHFWGVDPGKHHMVSFMIHVLNSILMFLAFAYMTGNRRNSLYLALLFAIHPMHVESVAWISERKDVLSTFFWLLTMISYTWYIRGKSIVRYSLCLAAFSLGLMSKAMVVTLPFVLILLDFWPLDRIKILSDQTSHSYRLIWSYLKKSLPEKLPFFILSIGMCVVTIQAQSRAMPGVADGKALSVVLNIFINYLKYFYKCFYPLNLSIFYPYPFSVSTAAGLASMIILLIISVAVVKSVKKLPFGFVGWFWFVGTLVPVVGIVQVGSQCIADRYTYIPFTGLFILVIWGSEKIALKLGFKKIHDFVMVSAVLILTMICYHQVRHWENSITLFSHAIKVNKNNYMAYSSLGTALYDNGDIDKAIECYKKSLIIDPTYSNANKNMGAVLTKQGHMEKAIEYYKKALEYDYQNSDIYFYIGVNYAKIGQIESAIEYYKKTLLLDPDMYNVYYNLANCYGRLGMPQEAEEHYKKAIALYPDYEAAYYNLGILQMNYGKFDDALESFKSVLKINPGHIGALNNSGLIYTKLGESLKAIELYQKILSMNPNDDDARNNLGNAYLNSGKIDEAIEQYKEALKINPNHKNARANLNMVYSVLEKRGYKIQKD